MRDDEKEKSKIESIWIKIMVTLIALAITVSSLGATQDVGKRTNSSRLRTSRMRGRDSS